MYLLQTLAQCSVSKDFAPADLSLAGTQGGSTFHIEEVSEAFPKNPASGKCKTIAAPTKLRSVDDFRDAQSIDFNHT
jgi:hypothetical protein